LERDEIRGIMVGDLWTNSTIYENVAYIVDSFGNRFMGTESERMTRDHILGLFEDYGLEDPHLEPYKYTCWRRGTCEVEMVSPIRRELWTMALPHSASTPPGGLEAEVIDVGKGTKEDFEAKADRIPRKIVMVTTGWPPGQNIHRTTKYGWTIDRGGVGYIYRNETPGQLIETGTIATGYRNTGEIPAVGVSFETGAFIERQLEKGPVTVRMKLHNEVAPNTTGWNIVGDITGRRHPERAILIGAHWDGHDISQEAAGDNILGAMVMLDAARALTRFKGKFNKTIRFVAFGNEECWTTGSINYVAQHEGELENIDIMLNGDGLGRRGDPVISVYNPPELVGPLSRLVGEHGIGASVVMSPMAAPSTSDNHPFFMKGIPTISCSARRPPGWTAGRGRDNHTTADTMDKIDKVVIKESAMLVAQLVMALADGDEPLGRHSTWEETLDALRRYDFIDVLKAQRRWHPDSVLGT
jgi:hypothetical protein